MQISPWNGLLIIVIICPGLVFKIVSTLFGDPRRISRLGEKVREYYHNKKKLKQPVWTYYNLVYYNNYYELINCEYICKSWSNLNSLIKRYHITSSMFLRVTMTLDSGYKHSSIFYRAHICCLVCSITGSLLEYTAPTPPPP